MWNVGKNSTETRALTLKDRTSWEVDMDSLLVTQIQRSSSALGLCILVHFNHSNHFTALRFCRQSGMLLNGIFLCELDQDSVHRNLSLSRRVIRVTVRKCCSWIQRINIPFLFIEDIPSLTVRIVSRAPAKVLKQCGLESASVLA